MENIEKLPEISKLTKDYKSDDLFICALGFEGRCIGGPKLLAEYGYRTENAIYINYNTHVTENQKMLNDLKKYLKKITIKEIYTSDYFLAEPDPMKSEKIFNEIYSQLETKHPINSISIDITSFTTIAIIHILNILFQKKVKNIRIVYTEAGKYFPLKSEIQEKDGYEKEDIASGIKKIVTLSEFGGFSLPGYSLLLILFLGFQPIRARGVNNFFQPSKKIGVIGIPRKQELSWRIELAKNRHNKLFGKNDEIIELTTFNYKDVIKKLVTLYKMHSESSNITIAPLGSKFQTLAIFLFARNYPDVQLLLTLPMAWNPKHYSEESGPVWEIKFKVDNM